MECVKKRLGSLRNRLRFPVWAGLFCRAWKCWQIGSGCALCLGVAFVACTKDEPARAEMTPHETEGLYIQHISQPNTCRGNVIFILTANEYFGGAAEVVFRKSSKRLTASVNLAPRDTLLDLVPQEYDQVLVYRLNSRMDSLLTALGNRLLRFKPDSTNYISFDGITWIVEKCESDSNRIIMLSMPGKYPDTPRRNLLMDDFSKVLAEIKLKNVKKDNMIRRFQAEAALLEP